MVEQPCLQERTVDWQKWEKKLEMKILELHFACDEEAPTSLLHAVLSCVKLYNSKAVFQHMSSCQQHLWHTIWQRTVSPGSLLYHLAACSTTWKAESYLQHALAGLSRVVGISRIYSGCV